MNPPSVCLGTSNLAGSQIFFMYVEKDGGVWGRGYFQRVKIKESGATEVPSRMILEGTQLYAQFNFSAFLIFTHLVFHTESRFFLR